MIKRALIRLRGDGVLPFLQGLITQDIFKLRHEPLIYSLMLSAQGRYRFDFFLFQEGDDILIDIVETRSEAFIKTLRLYVLRSPITITLETSIPSVTFRDPRHPNLPMYPHLSDEAAFRLGIPSTLDFEIDRSFPLEYGLGDLNAIDWKKGCYLGQELTARMHYRGLVRKRLLILESEVAFPLDTISDDSLTEVGVIRRREGNRGLALLRLEALDRPLTCGDVPVQVTIPPWVEIR